MGNDSFELLHVVMRLISKEARICFNLFLLEYEEIAERLAAGDEELLMKVLEMESDNNEIKN